jgi:hypothetical protein
MEHLIPLLPNTKKKRTEVQMPESHVAWLMERVVQHQCSGCKGDECVLVEVVQKLLLMAIEAGADPNAVTLTLFLATGRVPGDGLPASQVGGTG